MKDDIRFFAFNSKKALLSSCSKNSSSKTREREREREKREREGLAGRKRKALDVHSFALSIEESKKERRGDRLVCRVI